MENLSRLRWLCRRGMKELDVLMSRYLDEQYEQASEQDQQHFVALLEWQDPELFSVMVGRTTAEDDLMQAFIEKLRRLNSE